MIGETLCGNGFGKDDAHTAQAGDQRVSEDDELSDSQQTPWTPPTAPRGAPPRASNTMPGYATPQPVYPTTYVGLAPEILFEKRYGTPSVSEQQLPHIMHNQMTASHSRPAPKPILDHNTRGTTCA
jgi:hypothetical protein